MTNFTYSAEREVTRLAPCKINLTLDVGARRADGFHDLDSIVVQMLPADSVRVALISGTDAIRFSCSDPDLPQDDRNLAYRAALAFRESFSLVGGIEIELTKQLPAQAGLGGGSSDAAAVLLALRLLTEDTLNLSSTDLLPIAAALGSDVPLFLSDCPIRMQGRGERIMPLPILIPPLHGVLVRPNIGVPTAAAYSLLDSLPDRIPGDATERLLSALTADTTVQAVAEHLANDFEAAILPAFPDVLAAHEAVANAGALATLLCGSGSAVFGLAADVPHAEVLTRNLQGSLPWARQARSL